MEAEVAGPGRALVADLPNLDAWADRGGDVTGVLAEDLECEK